MTGALGLLAIPMLAAFGFAALLLSFQLLIFFPLTVVYEVWKRRTLRRLASTPFTGRVSVIVPAYNEEKTLRDCLETILASDYPDLEVIVVNDGSTDGTEQAIRPLIDDGRIRYVAQANAGKAAALNRGLVSASGEVILFTDADSIFLPRTVSLMVRWFAAPGIDAVCGNDAPLFARTPLQQAMAITTHIGTGFVRRALSVLGVLPIITGNLGAVRAATLEAIGGFRPIWGEDLEVTFRLHRARKRIVFDPDPIVRADCPATLSGLWRQRVRWVRSYVKIARMHKDLLRPGTAPPFSVYLPFNYFAQVVVPVLQLASVPVFARVAAGGGDVIHRGMVLLVYLGLLTFGAVALYSTILDRDWRALRHLPVAVLLIVPLSYFYNAVVVSSLWKEARGRAERWEKVERLPTGSAARWGGVGLAFVGAMLLVAVVIAERRATTTPLVPMAPGAAVSAREGSPLALATHFDAWADWRRAVTSVLANPDAAAIGTIGLGAGRPDWAYFRWEGHRSDWSATQQAEATDMLGESVGAFRERGFRTVAIVDLYAPKLVEQQPDLAALRFDGQKSPEQVSFAELVDGDYGRRVVEMVGYLACRYPVDAVALTELHYKAYGYEESALASYRRATGRATWPKDASGSVNTDDPSIWEWRSSKMEAFVARAAEAAHAGGKRLVVDVPVSWKDLSRNGRDSGLDYGRVLKHADQIVVWNYFVLEHKEPEVSTDVARALRRQFPADRVFVSLGLWGSPGILDPDAFKRALTATVEGGISQIWVTPNHLMTPAHWEVLSASIAKNRGLH